MVNEVALGMLWMMFGWKIALIYIISGLVVAILGGMVLGRMKLEHLVEDYVYQIKTSQCSCAVDEPEQTWGDRLSYAKSYTLQILKLSYSSRY